MFSDVFTIFICPLVIRLPRFDQPFVAVELFTVVRGFVGFIFGAEKIKSHKNILEHATLIRRRENDFYRKTEVIVKPSNRPTFVQGVLHHRLVIEVSLIRHR